jgi:4-amino-4-deoxy-L-arabinose transferase-like glycosyltransferase
MRAGDLVFWAVLLGATLVIDLALARRARAGSATQAQVDRLAQWASRVDDGYDWFLGRLGGLVHRLAPLALRLASRAAAPLPAPGADVAQSSAESPSGQAEVAQAHPPSEILAPEPAAPLASTTLVAARPSSSEADLDQAARVEVTIYVPAGATVQVTVEATSGAPPVVTVFGPGAAGLRPLPPAASAAVPMAPVAGRSSRPSWTAPLAGRLRAVAAAWRARPDALALTLFGASLVIYALTRLVGLDRYPIYFFTDEAVHTVLAADFLRDGYRNYQRELFPTYFSLGPSFSLNGVSVYLQVLPYLLFGKSVVITRGVSALVTLIAAAALGLTLRDIFRVRFWWVAALLLGLAPAWFLHSRTAFEYVEVASFYTAFLYFYLRYRCLAPRYLYAAIVCGALTFYTHGLGQVLMGVTGLLLLLADLRYHWQQRVTVQRGFLLLVVLALPYARYALAHPAAFGEQLRQRDSYWVQPGLALVDKLRTFGSEYAYGLSPAYWYLGNNGRDLERHAMNGYGNLWLPTLPFALVGLLTALRRWRSAAHRAVVVALLAAPVPAALVAIGIPRMLWALIPLTLLTALGFALALDWLADRFRARAVLALCVFALLAGVNLFLLRDSLVNGGRWSRDYTLAGTQYGAQQVFGEAVPAYLREHPDAEIVVSAIWANGTDLFVPFFLEPELQRHVSLGSLDYFTYDKRELSPSLLVVLTRREYDALLQNPKFLAPQIERVLTYPDGSPGFYFLRLAYSAQADALFAAELAERRRPVVETYELDGQPVTITHPRFGSGGLIHLFDGDPYTLVTAPEANPVLLTFDFATPRAVSGLTLTTGYIPDFTVTVRLFAPGSAEPVVQARRFLDLPPDPTVELAFDRGAQSAARVEVEITDHLAGADVNIHVREVVFR